MLMNNNDKQYLNLVLMEFINLCSTQPLAHKEGHCFNDRLMSGLRWHHHWVFGSASAYVLKIALSRNSTQCWPNALNVACAQRYPYYGPCVIYLSSQGDVQWIFRSEVNDWIQLVIDAAPLRYFSYSINFWKTPVVYDLIVQRTCTAS